MPDNMETATTMNTEHKEYASNSKANAALTTGIIGSALGALNLIGGGMAMCDESNKRNHHEHEHVQNGINEAKALGLLGMVNGVAPWYGGYGYGGARFNYNDFGCSWRENGCINCEEKELERKMAEDKVEMVRENYQGRLVGQKQLADAFFEVYKSTRDGFDIQNQKLNEAAFGLYKTTRDGLDIQNEKLNEAAFGLYKTDRDGFDALNQKITDASFGLYKNTRDGFDVMNQKLTDASFGLYKGMRDNKDEVMGTIWSGDAKINKKVDEIAFNLYKSERDDKDKLTEKINKLENKVDIMAAIRPYQDALINCKIDKNAIISDYNLSRRTCRMIEGELVLPNDPTVTGFKGADTCHCD